MALHCKTCKQKIVVGDRVTRCGCGFRIRPLIANMQQARLREVEIASVKLREAIESLQTLVDSYSESEGPFGSSHPRTCYINMLATLREKAKALAKGRV